MFQTPALWLCRFKRSAWQVPRRGPAGRNARDRLTLLELRAVFVSRLRSLMKRRRRGSKASRTSFASSRRATCPFAKVRPACFSEEGPFDPDADDVVMAPAARGVGRVDPGDGGPPAPSAAAPRPNRPWPLAEIRPLPRPPPLRPLLRPWPLLATT